MTEKQKLLKLAAAVVAVLCAVTVLFTFSRGGLLTLAAITPPIIWRSRHRAAMTLLIALGLGGFLLLTSDQFTQAYVERAQTISDYQGDRSAQGRFDAWTTSWRVFLDYPVFGVGPNNLEVVHRKYSPDPERFRVSHNAYLQILCECGLPALLLFVGAIGSAIWGLRRTRRETRLPWVEVYAHMMQISLLAYVVGSMFLSTAYSELLYQVIAMSVSLEVIAQSSAVEETGAAPVAAAGEPWWKRPLPSSAAGTALARRA
jgi:probable O-glycosylation ligase (exosortase A-associated)